MFEYTQSLKKINSCNTPNEQENTRDTRERKTDRKKSNK
jgi:hypothetical protein